MMAGHKRVVGPESFWWDACCRSRLLQLVVNLFHLRE